MKIAGIVAEYNPFHNGHAYHIEHTRAEREGEATHVVAVMSGYFTERGEPALADPFLRAKAALMGGVDLVIELPLPWTLSSAEHFALGGVQILDALSCVDMLSFGSECGSIEPLQKLAALLENERVNARMRGLLDMGISYAEARQKAVLEIAGEAMAALLDFPNNTLAIEYLRAIKKTGSSMTPYTVKRMGAGHDDMAPVGGMASASLIRDMVRSGRLVNTASYLPHAVCNLLSTAVQDGVCPADEALIERAVLAVLRRRPKEQLSTLPGLSEGIENRLHKAIAEAGSLEELYALIKTKRYPMTRVRRLVWNAFLGVTAAASEGMPPYIRVLAANEKGLEILRRAKDSDAKLPIVTRASQLDALDDRAKRFFTLECRAADMYALALPKPYPCGHEMTSKLERS
ncbi:MAG: nucleotidyltransferase family protein [Clostridia bacterium]|nr:nucleotidyltransferase family protein [Clostridia bacterium]